VAYILRVRGLIILVLSLHFGEPPITLRVEPPFPHHERFNGFVSTAPSNTPSIHAKISITATGIDALPPMEGPPIIRNAPTYSRWWGFGE